MAGIFDALKIIREQLPKFTQEMGVPFLGKDKPSSVMDATDPNAEKRILETILGAAATLPAIGKLGKVALANPFKTGAATAVATGDPTNLIGNPILALAASPGDAEASIRRGGMTSLNMTHETELYRLMKLLSGRASLSSPSVAISKNDARPFAGRSSASIVMNPNSHLFDPAEAHANQLLNRDMYAMRTRVAMKPPNIQEMESNVHLSPDDPDYLKEILTKAVRTRSIPLDARVGSQDVRLTEGVFPGEDQALSILASPNYRSFADYEKRGAPLLSSYKELPKGSHDYVDTREAIDDVYHSDALLKSFYDDMVSASTTGYSKYTKKQFEMSGRSFLDRLRDLSDKGDFSANLALKRIATNPSSYAELKVAGEVPINSRNVSAILLPNSTNQLHPEQLKQVVRNAEALGIPADTAKGLLAETGTAGYNQSELRLEKILDNVEREARHAVGSADSWEEFNAGLTPETKRYLDPYNLEQILTAKEEGVGLTDFSDKVRKAYENSDAFAADVIGMITHQATLK